VKRRCSHRVISSFLALHPSACAQIKPYTRTAGARSRRGVFPALLNSAPAGAARCHVLNAPSDQFPSRRQSIEVHIAMLRAFGCTENRPSGQLCSFDRTRAALVSATQLSCTTVLVSLAELRFSGFTALVPDSRRASLLRITFRRSLSMMLGSSATRRHLLVKFPVGRCAWRPIITSHEKSAPS